MAGAFQMANGNGPDRGLRRSAGRALAVEVVGDRGGSWVAVRGELDIASSARLHIALAEALAEARGGRMTVDLCGVGFIDASGVHELLGVADACEREQIALRILAPDAVRRVCVLADVADRLPID